MKVTPAPDFSEWRNAAQIGNVVREAPKGWITISQACLIFGMKSTAARDRLNQMVSDGRAEMMRMLGPSGSYSHIYRLKK